MAGTVRRHNPIDIRDPVGAILHFFVGDSYDPNRLHAFLFLDGYFDHSVIMVFYFSQFYSPIQLYNNFLFSFNCSKGDDHILRKLHPKGIWYLTVLGSLATTQREYIALHAFRRLNLQVTFHNQKLLCHF